MQGELSAMLTKTTMATCSCRSACWGSAARWSKHIQQLHEFPSESPVVWTRETRTGPKKSAWWSQRLPQVITRRKDTPFAWYSKMTSKFGMHVKWGSFWIDFVPIWRQKDAVRLVCGTRVNAGKLRRISPSHLVVGKASNTCVSHRAISGMESWLEVVRSGDSRAYMTSEEQKQRQLYSTMYTKREIALHMNLWLLRWVSLDLICICG